LEFKADTPVAVLKFPPSSEGAVLPKNKLVFPFFASDKSSIELAPAELISQLAFPSESDVKTLPLAGVPPSIFKLPDMFKSPLMST